jgi:membrane protease YdiL (CAAX protease family)
MDFGNPLDGDFWDEWSGDENTIKLFAGISVLMIVFLAAVLPQQELAGAATIYAIYLLAGITIGTIEYHFGKSDLEDFDYAGDSVERAGVAFVGGAVALLGYLAFLYPKLSSGAIAVPTISSGAVIFGIPSTVIFVLFLASYAEEKFYRMTALPTAKLWFYNVLHNMWLSGFLANVVQAFFFGFAHLAAVGNVGSLYELAVFGFIAGVLNYVFKSTYAGVGFHFARNALALHGQGLI